MRSISRDYDAVVAVGNKFYIFQDDEWFAYEPPTDNKPVTVTPKKINDGATWAMLKDLGYRNLDAVWTDDTTDYASQGNSLVRKKSSGNSELLNLLDTLKVQKPTPDQGKRAFDPELGLDTVTMRRTASNAYYYLFQDEEVCRVDANQKNKVTLDPKKIGVSGGDWVGLQEGKPKDDKQDDGRPKAVQWYKDIDAICETRANKVTSGYLVFKGDQVLELDKDGKKTAGPMPIMQKWPMKLG
ncbi:hypothetical protein [Streptomyces zagrosensis]|uniref:Uncharacterized protein n=1 Tax=Streptomyces zagrosensis TaxID=1042984 RepID=A0A7W9QH31_9ACTN|nr:hypothetical protein [Streptomyces zagrosensis]MBB5940145.1 hypothetical protein [Streptomyces zagrosensis]